MSTMAYEQILDSDGADTSLLQELQDLLVHPYDEQTDERSQRWFRRTPAWAEGLPGVTFFSCSS